MFLRMLLGDLLDAQRNLATKGSRQWVKNRLDKMHNKILNTEVTSPLQFQKYAMAGDYYTVTYLQIKLGDAIYNLQFCHIFR